MIERRQDPFGDARRIGRLLDVAQQDRELVAAEPRHRGGRIVAVGAGHDVGTAQRCRQAAGEGLQQQVAGGVAEAVVDQLEAIDVEIEDRGAASGAPRLGERPAEQLAELDAVGQIGDAVEIGQPPDLSDAVVEPAQHAVEGSREQLELVVGIDRDAAIELAARGRLGAFGELRERARDAAHQRQAEEQAAGEKDHADQQVALAQRDQVAFRLSG